jgi:methyltransferase (TIGR00027 family)
MTANRPSRTAEWVAAIRAAHLRYDRPAIFEDKFAIDLTSRGWRLIVNTPPLYRLVTRLTGTASARGTFMARARYTEEKLESAMRDGVGQYVILGAGLDSFAWRRRDLIGKLRVFEIDHPASQAAKRRRLHGLGVPVPENLEFIAVDFGRETVAEALARSHYRPNHRAFFSLLGTVQYISREALMNTLRSIAITAAPGSELVLSYVQPRRLVEPAQLSPYDRVTRFAARQGEPLVSLYDPAELAAEVCAVGYELVENFSPRDQALRYFVGRTDDLQPSALLLAHLAHFRVCRETTERSPSS